MEVAYSLSSLFTNNIQVQLLRTSTMVWMMIANTANSALSVGVVKSHSGSGPSVPEKYC